MQEACFLTILAALVFGCTFLALVLSAINYRVAGEKVHIFFVT